MRKKPGRHHLNLEAFAEPLSPEAKYWVGFLLADGCVSSNGNYDYIGLGLKFSDVEHVRKFARFVGVREESVRERLGVNNFGKNHAAQLVFSGKGLVPQLAKYGIVPRKTKTASVPLLLEHDPDFWRGLIDGDGSITKDRRGYNQIRLYGTLAIIEGFREICYIITGLRPALITHGSIFQSGLYSSKATKLLHWLYYPGAVALERKAKAWAQ